MAPTRGNRRRPERPHRTPSAQALVGRLLCRKWRIERLLNTGGTSWVYSATHRNGRRVAIKVLLPELSADARIRGRFLREGYLANRVGHPGAVCVLDDDTQDGFVFLVLELLEGANLERLARDGERGAGEVAFLIDGLLDVLVAAHDNGIVHRDIKPSNVFLTKKGEIKLLDFGIARLGEPSISFSHTSGGAVLGTPGFMAPEQALGRSSAVGPRTDIWAVGATMFRLLTGRVVYDAPSGQESLVAAATTPAPPLKSLRPDVPDSLAILVDRALRFESEERWPDARDMLRVLRAARSELPTYEWNGLDAGCDLDSGRTLLPSDDTPPEAARSSPRPRPREPSPPMSEVFAGPNDPRTAETDAAGSQRWALPPSGEPAIVEREGAIKALLAPLAAVRLGEMRVAFIRGPTGIGKTRLAAELMREVKALGVDAHIGRCFDGDAAAPFLPWLQVVRSGLAARSVADAPEIHATLSQLAWIAPELVASNEVDVRADLQPSEARFRLFDALRLFLLRLSEMRPILVVLDDLQWADQASLLLLEFLIQALTGARVYVVGIFRDKPRPSRTLSRVLELGARQAGGEFVDLEGLHRESVSKLLAHAAGERLAPEFAEAVFLATQGNPFFLSEIAKLVARGELDAADPRGTIPVPKRARDAVRWQLERLSTECRRALEFASIMGRQFDMAVLSRLEGDAPSAVLQRLAEAEAVGLVNPIDEKPVRLAFTHDLVRESIYRDIPATERVRMHRRIGEVLESSAQADSQTRTREIAYHYLEATADGTAEKAVHFGRLAGDQAYSQMAFEDAVTDYERALSALSAVPNASPKASSELLLLQARAAWGTTEPAVAVQARFEKAAEAARVAGDAEFLARAALGRTGDGAGPGDFRDISVIDELDIGLLSEALTGLEHTPSALRAVVLARLALAVQYTRGLRTADDLSRAATELAEELGELDTLATVLRFRHEVLSGPQFVRERLAFAERILRLARIVGSRPLELDALFFVARAHFELGDVARASKAGNEADALAKTMRHPGALFRSGIRKVLILTMVGAFDEAERRALSFYERDAARNMGSNGTLGLQLGMVRTLRGDHLGAIATVHDSYDPTLPWTVCAVALARLRTGQPADARRLLETSCAANFRDLREDHTLLSCYVVLADICDELGDSKSAYQVYQRLLPYEPLVIAPFLGTLCLGAAARALGALAALLGNEDDAERHFVRALAIEEALASPPLIASTLERYAALLARRMRAGDRERAAAMIARASGIAESLGMNEVLRRCRETQSGLNSPRVASR